MVKLVKEVIRIGICDDEVEAIDQIRSVIEEAPLDTEVEVYTFTKGKYLLEFVEQMPFLNYIFLDILMDELSGIEVAQRILEKRPDIQIIFVSNSNDYREESNQLGAFSYYLKSDNERMIPCDLTHLVEEFNRSSLFVRVKSKEIGIVDVALKDVLYIDIYSRNMHIVTSHHRELCVCDKDVIDRLLNYYDFGQARLNTVVNYAHVIELKNDRVTLTNGEQLEIARRKYCTFKQKYKCYQNIDGLDFLTKKRNRIGRYRMVDVIQSLD